MVETFKKIKRFENYSVSDHGNVRNDKLGRILKGSDNGPGFFASMFNANKNKT